MVQRRAGIDEKSWVKDLYYNSTSEGHVQVGYFSEVILVGQLREVYDPHLSQNLVVSVRPDRHRSTIRSR